MPKKKRNAARTDHSVEYDHIAYRFLGLPTKAQAEQFRRTIGCARFLWNRMLGDRLDLYRIMGLTVYNTPADYKDLDELFFLNEVDSLALANVQLRLELFQTGCPVRLASQGSKRRTSVQKPTRQTVSITTSVLKKAV